jgi:hypothetical protein
LIASSSPSAWEEHSFCSHFYKPDLSYVNTQNTHILTLEYCLPDWTSVVEV